ncbi:hypothetical protein TNIN_56171 [Trichonephila inaurata madagascariensis]|uniref:Uncharacterized protein n=1 Tax=Trichonephila inaurata madagascariensis TaxID=2747483 RepID=A0A8X6YYH9_9ARAC|nr:hypothetical protein TNIN_56171 [Trichonephila inaurata madagascariensis]
MAGKEQPPWLEFDSQPQKKRLKRGSRGYKAGKKKGQTSHYCRYFGVLLLKLMDSANVQDRDGALDLFVQAKKKTNITEFFADKGGTPGALQNNFFLKNSMSAHNCQKASDAVGF